MGISDEVLAPLGHVFRQFFDIVGFDGFDLVFWRVDGLVVPLEESGCELEPMKVEFADDLLEECRIGFIRDIVPHSLFLAL